MVVILCLYYYYYGHPSGYEVVSIVVLIFIFIKTNNIIFMCLFNSVTQSCLTLCNAMDHSTPGLPVHHQLLEYTQTHVVRVGDAIPTSHPLSSPTLLAPNPSQY